MIESRYKSLIETVHDAANGVRIGGITTAIGGVVLFFGDATYNVANNFTSGNHILIEETGKFGLAAAALGIAAVVTAGIVDLFTGKKTTSDI